MATDLQALIQATLEVREEVRQDFGIDRARSLRPLPFRERTLIPWMLVAADLAMVQLVMALSHFLWDAVWPAAHINSASAGMRAGILLVPVGCYLAGLYPGFGLGPVERMRRRTIGVALTFGSLIAWDSFVNHSVWSRGLLLLTFVFTAVVSPAVEAAIISVLIWFGKWGTPVVVLSSNHAGACLVRTLRQRPELGLVPVALFKTESEMWGMAVDGVPILGPPPMAASLTERVGAAIVVMPGIKTTELVKLVECLPFRRVIVVPELSGLQSLWVNARDLGGSLGLELTRNLLIKRNYCFKRVMDYALGIPLFLLSAPLIGLLALWIKRVSPGPAFYTQEREGMNGKPIRIWKLRTMTLDADSALNRYLDSHPDEHEHWRRFFKLKHDPRILPGVGHLLRHTSLDELPQLWNVLRGELSLVGPRPFPRYHMQSFPGDFCCLRRSVMPGITGFWQISARSDGDLQVQQRLDTYYIRNWSPWLDTYIMARTAVIVLRRDGAY